MFLGRPGAPRPKGRPEVERGAQYLREQRPGGPSYGQQARWGAPTVLGVGEGGQESLETGGLQGPSRVGQDRIGGTGHGTVGWPGQRGWGAGDRDECADGRQRESDGSR